MPHGQWEFGHSGAIWLHASSDTLIGIIYYSISFMLIYFVCQGQNVHFKWIFWILGAFIVSCGTTHLIEVWTLWYPAYWVLVSIKAITAIVSIFTALALYPLIPQLLALPPVQLKSTPQNLESEITEYQSTEIALQKSENNYQGRVEDQTELICRFEPDGILTFVNHVYCPYFDKTPEELIGISFDQFLPGFEEVRLQNLLETLTVTKPVIAHEHLARMPNGEQIWHEWTNRAIFDEHNNLVEYQVLGRDITAIRESERRFQAVFNQTFQFISLLKPDGTILEANQTFLEFTGVKHEDIVGKAFYQYQWWLAIDDEQNQKDIETKHRIAQAQIREAIAKTLQGECMRYEMMVIGKDKQVITLDFSLKSIYNEFGQV